MTRQGISRRDFLKVSGATLIGTAVLPGAGFSSRPASADSSPYQPPNYQSTTITTEDAIIEKNVMLVMRDGVRNATDLYYPASGGQKIAGQFPVLLQRTPYDKAGSGNVNTAQYFVKRGYVVALQDCRGRFGSMNEGHWMGYDEGNQGRDAFDTIEWLGTQSWSNGKVAMWGHSYPAVLIYAAAAENPPHFAGGIASAAHSDYAAKGLRNNGAFEMRFYQYAFQMAVSGNKWAAADPALVQAVTEARNNFNQWLDKWPIKRGESPLAGAPDYEKYYFKMATSGDWPGPDAFWTYSGHNIELYYTRMSDRPMVHITGWYDTYARAEGEVYENLAKIKKTRQELIYGPRIHTTNWTQTSAGDAEFGQAANENFNEFCLRHFDFWCKGIDTGLNSEPPVKLFIMGGGTGKKTAQGRLDVGGQWRWETEYPLARTNYTNYYLHPDKSLTPVAPKEAQKNKLSFKYDPNNPVPTIGGNISAFGSWLVAGGYNQVVAEKIPVYVKGKRVVGQKLAERPDVLSFETAPLEQDVEVTGRIDIVLYASSDAPDTDFTAKLVDVYPPNSDYPEGYALNLADGISRGRYREGRTNGGMTAKMLEKNKIYEFTIMPYDVGNLFKKGHKIRLDISSSNYPRFDFNPNTGEPLAEHTHTQVATNTVYMDPDHPSHVVLPIIPAK